jgi:hypothetical protein
MENKKIIIVTGLLMFLSLLFLTFKALTGSQIPEMNAGSLIVSPQMLTGVTIDAASSDFGSGKDFSVDSSAAKKEIDSASAAGFDLVRFNIKKETLENAGEQGRMDEIISYARSKKLKIYIGYFGKEAWLNSSVLSSGGTYGGGKAGWEEFKKGYNDDVSLIMNKYHPDYILILPQCPYGVGRQVNSERTVEEWFNFSKDVAFSIKKISYGTKVALEEAMISSDPQKEPEMELAQMALENNDSVLDIISTSAGSVAELEEAAKNLYGMGGKNHWHGELWIGSVDSSFLDESSFFSAKDRENKRKDFYLYYVHLASNDNFGGVIISKLRDGKDGKGGIIGEDYSPKVSYDAIKQVMKNRK